MKELNSEVVREREKVTGFSDSFIKAEGSHTLTYKCVVYAKTQCQTGNTGAQEV